ncbi:MAG: diguanylate cyclase domain-containing protein [Paenisporosarcina sp.]
MINLIGSRYLNQLDKVAEEVITLLSETIDVNTIFLATNDNSKNFIVKAFNRKAQLLREGENSPLNEVLCKLVVENDSEPVVITELEKAPLTFNHPVSHQLGNGCFLGAPIYQANGEIYGTICAFDTKPYEFSAYDVRMIKTLSSLLSQTIILEDQLHHDHLTGLYNSQYLKAFFERMKEESLQYSLLYVDLDRFKDVNDHYGHDMGDELLKKIASLFTKLVTKDSVVARIGGDEFVFLIPVSSKEMKESSETAFRIICALTTNPIEVEGQELTISASIGMTYVEPGKPLKVLLKEADSVMYEAKRNGRNNINVH